ncbi:MAG: lipase family protein [Bacteroidetes bacterium]|nr:lipase family protein [Bacteroidota bacterium]
MRLNFTFLFVLLSFLVSAQTKLQPGFDGKEYTELLSLAFNGNSIADSAERFNTKDTYHLEYISKEVGLMNRWSLFLRDDNVAVINLRGTVNHTASWLENFYAAMIPASGSLQVNDSTVFNYQFAADQKAMVHTGWALGIAYLAPDIEQKINYYFEKNKVTDFLIFGHSQGGALAFLLRSYLQYEKQKGKIPATVNFKTYCSAAPKPGNLYYAYDFDFITRNGWAFTVVNAADWVPETPFSLQTLNDFNPTNPFTNAKSMIKKQKFFVRLALNHVYNKLNRSTGKSQKVFEKYLGKNIYKQVKKTLPQFRQPEYAHGNNYMRAGVPIVLQPDEEYRKIFPDSTTEVFIHHLFAPYYYLIKKYYLQ